MVNGDLVVRRAVSSADAVIGALGPSLDRRATGMRLVEGTRTIVEAMQVEGIERYIGMATPSLRDERDGRSLLGVIVPFMGRTFLKRAYPEVLDMSQLITGSSLNWTIARSPSRRDGQRTRTVRAGFLGQDKIGAAITRADNAGFLLDQTLRLALPPRGARPHQLRLYLASPKTSKACIAAAPTSPTSTSSATRAPPPSGCCPAGSWGCTARW